MPNQIMKTFFQKEPLSTFQLSAIQHYLKEISSVEYVRAFTDQELNYYSKLSNTFF